MAGVLHVVSPQAWVGEQFLDAAGAAHGSHTVRARTASPVSDPGDASAAPARQCDRRNGTWHVKVHNGLAPLEGFDEEGDALWIAPGLLIALNAWRGRSGMTPIELEAPPANWQSLIPAPLLGHSVVLVSVGQIARWHDMPRSLGERPWSRICNGRVDGFRAARRDLAALQLALQGRPDASDVPAAPKDSLIELSAHVPGIEEEWSVLVRNGVPMGSSPYCVHRPVGGRHIVTVFDEPFGERDERFNERSVATLAATASGTGAQAVRDPDHNAPAPSHPHPTQHADLFDQSHREPALRAAGIAARAADIRTASLLVAFQINNPDPYILEIDPVWCSTPFAYEPVPHEQNVGPASGLGMFADAVIDTAPSRLRASLHNRDSRCTWPDLPGADISPYVPDPWMVRDFARRYVSYPAADSVNIQRTSSKYDSISQPAYNNNQARYQ